MESPLPVFRLHGQTRGRTIGLALLGLAFVIVFRLAVVVSASPEPIVPLMSWITWGLIAVLSVGVVRSIWHAFAPRVEVLMGPYPFVIGEPMRIAWEFQSHKGRVRDLRIEARFLGARYDRQGYVVDHPSKVPLVRAKGEEAARGDAEVELPRQLVPTSKMRKRETGGKWTIEVRARVEGAPGVFESYPARFIRRGKRR